MIGAWPTAWLVFVPGSGYFPYSGIALTELDQLGALVTITVVFGVRLTSKAKIKIESEVRHRFLSATHEDIELGPQADENPMNIRRWPWGYRDWFQI
jgi:hypothetical protein